MLAGTLGAPEGTGRACPRARSRPGGHELAAFLAGPGGAGREMPATDERGRRIRERTTAELVVEGRIATLAGATGFGWVEAIAIGGGRILAGGTRQAVDGWVGPGTRRFVLPPAEVAMPGLTDAHVHLAAAAMSARQVDLEAEPTIEAGLARRRGR